MKWYFALAAATLNGRDHGWPGLIRAAVHSARKNTGLQPHLLWDGPNDPFIDELRALGVTVIPHRVGLYAELARDNAADRNRFEIATGCFLRVDIPIIEQTDDYVLYTDADVIFLRDPGPILSGIRPGYFGCTSEFTFDDDLNSGVLWLNIPRMRADHAAFTTFIRENLGLGLDQDMYRHFYASRHERLPPELNWKPYWGRHDDAVILHWHGIKPALAQRVLDDPRTPAHPDHAGLVARNPHAYRHYLTLHQAWSQDAPPAAPKYRFSICACARWETPYICEWLAYHRAIGFEHVFLYCNDDDPAELFARLLPFTQGSSPFVTFRHHPIQGEQSEMYSHFLLNFLTLTEWVSFLDIDEFLRLPAGLTISQFIQRFPVDVESVLFSWVFFGPNGHKRPPAGTVLQNFTRREARIHSLTKQVTKAAVIYGHALHAPGTPKSYWHTLFGHVTHPVKTVNALGEDMAEFLSGDEDERLAYVNHPARKQRLFETAVIHHYAFRSEAAFKERRERGLGGNFGGQRGWAELADHANFDSYLASLNEVEDTRLAKFWNELLKPAYIRAYGVFPGTGRIPVSRHKAASQSSTYVDPASGERFGRPEAAVNGRVDGSRKFHTALETNPWWQVDLGAIRTIEEIHVYNTIDHTASRCRDLVLSVSIDGAAWVELARKADGEVIGGITSTPFIWSGPGKAWSRYVRITLLGREYFHLDQVEVFGV